MPDPQRALVIATPSIDGNVSAHYTGSLVRSLGLLRQRGVHAEIHFEIGNSLIADARNKLVSKFLASGASDLLFIDADLSWNAEDLARLVSYPVPMVAGVYQRKSRTKLDFSVKFGPAIVRDAHGLMAVERVGTGFMRLRRDCIERMVAAHPHLKLRNPTDPADEHLYALFDTVVDGGQFIGEDFAFCDRWRAIGGEVLIDPAIAFAHHGSAAYDEPLLKYLQKNG
ncbi:MAG TPA: hypothetical protein VF453_16055 [Burkholderiaceae bacterium]